MSKCCKKTSYYNIRRVLSKSNGSKTTKIQFVNIPSLLYLVWFEEKVSCYSIVYPLLLDHDHDQLHLLLGHFCALHFFVCLSSPTHLPCDSGVFSHVRVLMLVPPPQVTSQILHLLQSLSQPVWHSFGTVPQVSGQVVRMYSMFCSQNFFTSG